MTFGRKQQGFKKKKNNARASLEPSWLSNGYEILLNNYKKPGYIGEWCPRTAVQWGDIWVKELL